MSDLKKRRAFMLKSSPEYVRDGLVLWLDAEEPLMQIEKNTGDDLVIWSDRAQLGQRAEVNDVLQEDNKIVFDGTGSFAKLGTQQPVVLSGILRGLSQRTLEVVCRLEDDLSVQTVILGYGYTVTPEIGSAGLWYRPASGGFKVGTWDDSPCVPVKGVTNRTSYSIVYGDTDLTDFIFYQNGVECPQGDTDGNMYSAGTALGARIRNDGNPQYYFKGEINCIRIYNRKLSEAERLQNFAVDKRRFGIGVG